MSDEPRRLNLRPERRDAPCCPECAGTGRVLLGPPALLVTRCGCPAGKFPGSFHWRDLPIHPDDWAAIFGETKKPASVAKSVDISKGGAYATK